MKKKKRSRLLFQTAVFLASVVIYIIPFYFIILTS